MTPYKLAMKMAYKWGVTNHLLTGMILQVVSRENGGKKAQEGRHQTSDRIPPDNLIEFRFRNYSDFTMTSWWFQPI